MPRLLLLLLLPFTVLAEGFHNNYPHAAHSGFWKWKWEQLRLTWVGHATFLIQAGGLNILTDPQFSERASPVPFAGPKYDHLDLPTLRALAASVQGSPLFLVPLGLKA